MMHLEMNYPSFITDEDSTPASERASPLQYFMHLSEYD